MTQFKIDENLPEALVSLLVDLGHDACSVRQQKLNGRPDIDIAAACKNERRVIVTLDLDFSDITAFLQRSTPGSSFSEFAINRDPTS